MNEQALQQLQRLGIDIWVTPERAAELIQAGEAHSLHDVASPNTSQNERLGRVSESRQGVSTRPNRNWSSRQANVSSNTNTTSGSADSSQQVSIKVVDNPEPQAFKVSLNVFCFDTAVVVLERDLSVPERLVHDILFALSRFKVHPKHSKQGYVFVNRLEFHYPAGSVRVLPDTSVESAQEAFRAWFSNATTKCELVLAIGEAASRTVAKAEDVEHLIVEPQELADSPDAKLRIWQEIQKVQT